MDGYHWPCPHGKTPFEHQKLTTQFLIFNRFSFCFNEQGTGKTASVIWAADWLLSVGLIRRVLVVCPLSVMQAAWQADLFQFAVHRSVGIAHGSSNRRRKVIAAGAEFVIINFDGVEIVEQEIINGGFDLVVIDEGSAYKNHQTKRWKAMNRIKQHVKALWLLTGTPAAQAPTDAYGLAKLVNPNNVPRFLGEFRDQTMVQVSKFRWVPRPGAKDVVFKALQPAIRFEKRQCIDLPPVTHLMRQVRMTPQQRKYYDELKKEQLITVGGVEVSAPNAAVVINKLVQIACGSVYTDDRQIMDFDASERMNAVLEAIMETQNKVLVFVPYTNAIDALKDFLEQKKVSVEVIDGRVSAAQRGRLVHSFQNTADPYVLILQPQAAAHGLTLTAADTIIWYAPVTSVETYLQANARIDRPGQRNTMTVIHINGSPIETRLYSMLAGNVNNHDAIVDLYRAEISSQDS